MFNSKKWKTLFAAMMMITLTAIFSACGFEKDDDAEEVKEKIVTVGTMNLINGDLIAQYEKLYEKELGMKVKLLNFNSGKEIIAALGTGEIDIGEAGTAPTALAISSHIDVEVIFIGDVIGAAETLVARNDSGISSVKDLIGKKVATPFSSTAQYSLLNVLKLEGMTETDVQILDMKPDDIFTAWQNGEIDAAYIWYPVLGRLLENGKSITDSEKLAEKGIVTADLFVMRSVFAEKNPDVVKKFVEVQLKANDMILNNPQKAAKEIAAVLGITENEAAEQITKFKYLTADEQIDLLDNSMAKILKSTADFLVEQKSLKKAASLEEFQKKIISKYLK